MLPQLFFDFYQCIFYKTGAHTESWTRDLSLTKGVLYLWAIWAKLWFRIMERVAGIEPAPSAWKAEVLPLNYTRVTCHKRRDGGGGRIRTFEGWAVRFTVWSLWPLGNPSEPNFELVPAERVELPTYWLQVSCSTYWAKSASSSAHSRESWQTMQLKICIKCSVAHILSVTMQKICNVRANQAACSPAER